LNTADDAAASPPRTPGAAERAFVRANEAAVVAMAATMVVLVATNVVCRYGLDFSLVWAEEVSQYLMVWVTFVGAGLALRQGRHVAVEMLQDRLHAGRRRALRWGLFGLMLAFLLVVTLLGLQFAWFARDMETPVLNIPLAIPYLAVPVGTLLAAVHLAFIARDYAAGQLETPESIEPPVDERAI
jgi:TRAP-type C4-dicarboxylate transport system permease small subunit